MNGRLSQYPFKAIHRKNFGRGRQGYRPVWFVVHCTDTGYQDNYPANLGRYWTNNPVGVSTHFGVSDTMTYQYVDLNDTAFQARNPTNLRGVGVEITGRAGWSRNEWLAHKLMLRRAATLCAEVTLACGFKTEPALLSVSALKARNSGLTCHRDVTNAFQGTHTDPGSNFPWDYFLVELRNALRPVKDEQKRLVATQPSKTPTPTQGDALMAVTDQEWDALVKQVSRLNAQADRSDSILTGGFSYKDSRLNAEFTAIREELTRITAALDKIAAKG